MTVRLRALRFPDVAAETPSMHALLLDAHDCPVFASQRDGSRYPLRSSASTHGSGPLATDVRTPAQLPNASCSLY